MIIFNPFQEVLEVISVKEKQFSLASLLSVLFFQ